MKNKEELVFDFDIEEYESILPNKYLLTDFNKKRDGFDIKNIEVSIEELNKKAKYNTIIGCIGDSDLTSDAMKRLKNASHIIKDLEYIDGKVYGNVKFLNNDNGRMAKTIFDNDCCYFDIVYKRFGKNRIFTWNIKIKWGPVIYKIKKEKS